jgi:imidazolonepropionase-like amidohydrolase
MSEMEAVAEEIQKVGNKMIVHVNSLDEARAAVNTGVKFLVHGVDD